MSIQEITQLLSVIFAGYQIAKEQADVLMDILKTANAEGREHLTVAERERLLATRTAAHNRLRAALDAADAKKE